MKTQEKGLQLVVGVAFLVLFLLTSCGNDKETKGSAEAPMHTFSYYISAPTATVSDFSTSEKGSETYDKYCKNSNDYQCMVLTLYEVLPYLKRDQQHNTNRTPEGQIISYQSQKHIDFFIKHFGKAEGGETQGHSNTRGMMGRNTPSHFNCLLSNVCQIRTRLVTQWNSL